MPAGKWANRVACLRAYIVGIAVASVAWESAQMPLYTLWRTGTPAELAADVLQCTLANILIATASLAAAIFLTGRRERWLGMPLATLLLTCFIAVSYTVYSEWLNVYVKGTWAYSDLMPVVPGLEVGVSPLVQWVVLPIVGILLAKRESSRRPRETKRSS